jgi:hypothetical protein
MTPTPSKELMNMAPMSNNLITQVKSVRTRFIGKHSRDNRLSIFLHNRNSNSPSELLGLVRINKDALHLIHEKGATVIVGVMARLLCDHGLQFSEHFVYQKETPIYPPAVAIECPEIELVQGVLGDAVLPDEFHRGFRIKLPAVLPPSCIFLSPDTSMGPGITGDSPWGLTYYLYAYMATQPHHRKSSKVFLSFTRALPSDPAKLVRETTPPAVTVSKNSTRLLSATSKPLTLSAALDRSFFYTNDQMAVHLRIDNPRAINFTGIRITLKQIITTRALNQSRQVIKVPLATYEFRSIDVNGKFQRSQPPYGSSCYPKDFPFIIDTLRVILKPGTSLQHVAVESLLPRNTIKSLIMCPTFTQTYEMQDNPLKYFAIEYYMNVHVVLPWGTNLIAKLPFTVASRGVNEDDLPANVSSSIDNLASFNPADEDIEEGEEDNEKLENTLEPKQELGHQKESVQIDFKIVKCDMERALKQLEIKRNSTNNKIKSKSDQNSSFVQMRRTWVREFAESFDGIQEQLANLDNLLEVIMIGKGKRYTSGFPVDFIQNLTERFIPLYLRFQNCHQFDHFQVLEDALNQTLDTLELVLMKFHLLFTLKIEGETTAAANSEVNLDDLWDVLNGRLKKEVDKLVLVIPGMIEWRWFLEELFYPKYPKSANESSHRTETDSNDQIQMANLFQSIHERLTESFTDAQIKPQEIFNYAQLLFNNQFSNEAIEAHYSYFRQALLTYYGNYPKLFLPFDQAAAVNNDLKTMRQKLTELREKLIQSMI